MPDAASSHAATPQAGTLNAPTAGATALGAQSVARARGHADAARVRPLPSLNVPGPWRLLDHTGTAAFGVDAGSFELLGANRDGVLLLGMDGDGGEHGDAAAAAAPLLLDSFAPELAAAIRARLPEIVEGAELLQLETTLARVDGRTARVAATVAGGETDVPGAHGLLIVLLADLELRETLRTSLAGAEARFDALFNADHYVALLIDPSDGSIVDANSAASRFYGYPHDELVSLNVGAINTMSPDALAAEMARALAHGQRSFSFRHRLASGAVRDVDVTSGPIIIDGRPLLYSIVDDVTEKREAERQAERIQRLYAAMSEIDRLIARTEDEETLFREGCRIAVQVAGFAMAWVGRVNESLPTRPIEVIAFGGEHVEYVVGIKVAASPDVEEGHGATGRAVRERRPIVIDDVFADPGMKAWWDRAGEVGFASVAALPLFVPGRPPHIVAVYSPTIGAFGPAELGVLGRIVDDIAFRLEVIDGERARRAAEDALRASEERYRGLVDQAPVGIYVVDADGAFVDASAAACEILGCPIEDLRGRSVADIAGAAMGEVVVGYEHLVSEGAVRLAIPYERPDGTQIDVEVHARRLPDGRIQGVLRDVTATRSTEAERDRLAAAMEQVGESVAIVGLDGLATYVNPVFQALSGYSREEMVGRPILTVRSGVLDPAVYAEMDAAGREGRTWSGRIVNRRKDGTYYEMDLVCSPVRDRLGNLVGVVQVGRDTSQERALEAQLAEAQRMEAVGRLAGGVAHDFNNLLTAISGYAELALGELHEPDAAREDIAEILRAAGRASTLTRQLLAFSRRQLLQPRLVDVGAVLEGIAPMLRRLIGEDVGLDVRCDPGAGCVLADEGQLEQVVMNLAVNARDAMPGGGELRLEARAVSLDAAALAGQPGINPGLFVEMRVSDTGTGMSPDVLEHVFEPFFTTKERGKGTGLGLSMVFGIVRQSNGFITVDSTPGHGSTFSVFLPRASGESASLGEPQRVPARGSGTETILVVEDEPLVRTFARRVLQQHGFRVLEADGGIEALEIATREGDAIDLLFTDVVMPSMGGRELAAQLLRARPDLRVLYASGYTEDALAGRTGSGEVAYLGKPYGADELVARVQEVLAAAPERR